jgi:hypothetical protein
LKKCVSTIKRAIIFNLSFKLLDLLPLPSQLPYKEMTFHLANSLLHIPLPNHLPPAPSTYNPVLADTIFGNIYKPLIMELRKARRAERNGRKLLTRGQKVFDACLGYLNRYDGLITVGQQGGYNGLKAYYKFMDKVGQIP